MSECDRLATRLSELLELDAPIPGRAELEQHAETCDACRATLAAYRGIEHAYRALPESDAPPELAARVLADARQATTERVRRRKRQRLVLAAAGLLVVLVPLAAFLLARRDSARDLLRSGEEQQAAGRLEGARAAYQEALELALDDELAAEILLRLAQLDLATHQPASALARLLELERRTPQQSHAAEALTLRLEALLALGHEDEARATYELLARDFPAEAARLDLRLPDAEVLTPAGLDALTGLGYGGD